MCNRAILHERGRYYVNWVSVVLKTGVTKAMVCAILSVG